MIHKWKLNKSIKEFDQAYLEVRTKEDRIFQPTEIENLPDVPSDHIHYSEWMKRKHTFEMFNKYLGENDFKTILDLACGNGWFLNKLASRFEKVVGIEVNELELEQAEKILDKHNNTSLHLGDIFKIKLDEKFDLITINAAIQYFTPFEKIVNKLLSLLSKNGELHILDSPFYLNKTESKLAKKRTQSYYSQNGAPGLSAYYHHHNLIDLKKFKYEILYNPNSISNKIKRKLRPISPFFWIKITQ